MDALKDLVFQKLGAVWQRRWIAILVAWVVCAGGWAGVMMIPNQYESSARLYVDTDAVMAAVLRGVSLDAAPGGGVDIIQRTLLSRPNLQKLISKTDLDLNLTNPGDVDKMINQLASDIRLVPQTANLFTITYRNPSPKVALDVVQNILNAFIESKIGNNRSDMENAQNFLGSQIDNYERQLRDAERRRAEFRTKYIDLLPGDGGGISRYESAQQNVKRLRGTLEDARARQAALTKELANTPQTLVSEAEAVGGGGGGGGPNRAQLLEAERHLAELRLRYTDEYPEVVSTKNLIAAIRAGALNVGDPEAPRAAAPAQPRSRSVPNPTFEQLKVRVVENESNIASLERQVADAEAERSQLEEVARGAPGLQAEYLNLNRDYDVLRRNYEELLGRREQMRIAQAADLEANKVKVQIIDPPQRPRTPVAPKRLVLLSGVLLAGIGAGIVLTLLISEIDSSFQSVDDLRSLGLPVIGGISIITETVSLWRRVFSVGSVVTAMAILCAIYGGLIYRLIRAGVA